jgi:hypothetical protein
MIYCHTCTDGRVDVIQAVPGYGDAMLALLTVGAVAQYVSVFDQLSSTQALSLK